jgi:hypothetical protein
LHHFWISHRSMHEIFVIMLSFIISAFRYHPSYCPSSFYFHHVHGVWITMHVYHEFCHKLRLLTMASKLQSLISNFQELLYCLFFWLQLFNVNKPIAEKIINTVFILFDFS